MARVILKVLVFLSVWFLYDSKRLRRLETRVARLEDSVVHREELADCVVGDKIVHNVDGVKASVAELKTHFDKSIEGLKEDILAALRDSVTSCCQTNAPTQAPGQSTTTTTSQTHVQPTDTSLPQVLDQSTKTTAVTPDQTTIPATTSPVQLPSCLELHHSDERQSGIYTIYPLPSKQAVQVYCDMNTDGGGWTVFQRRQDGSVNFNRTWADYASGFGNISGEFWLGNDLISSLTSQGPHELRIDLKDFSNHSAYAKYSTFQVLPSDANYKLKVGVFSGNAGDSLDLHSGMAFTTRDRDNDRSGLNCADHWGGGWWYYSCGYSNLNGRYGHGYGVRGVWWWHWKRNGDPLMWTEMKLRATPQG